MDVCGCNVTKFKAYFCKATYDRFYVISHIKVSLRNDTAKEGDINLQVLWKGVEIKHGPKIYHAISGLLTVLSGHSSWKTGAQIFFLM